MAKPRRKRTFDCGHKGGGQFCHRCAEADKLLDQAYELGNKGKIDAFEFRKMRIRVAELRAVSSVLPAHLEDVGFSLEEAYAIIREINHRGA